MVWLTLATATRHSGRSPGGAAGIPASCLAGKCPLSLTPDMLAYGRGSYVCRFLFKLLSFFPAAHSLPELVIKSRESERMCASVLLW
jgi:hypothetical protein